MRGFFQDKVLKLLVQGGIPAEKLNLGLPLYGQTYQLASPSSNGIGAKAVGRGNPGQYTIQGGMLSFYEICHAVTKRAWTKVAGNADHGPYAYNGNQWVAYDDADSAMNKAEFVLRNGFGGVALWTIDFDDFNNMCCYGVNPILNTVSKVLRGYGRPVRSGDCSQPPPVSTPAPISMETTPWSDGGSGSTSSYPEYPVTQATTTNKPTQPTQAPTQPTQPSQPSPPSQPGQAGEKCDNGRQTKSHKMCTKYYRCIQFVFVEADCPGGLYWNNEGQYCDWSTNVKCNGRLCKHKKA